MLTTVSFFSRNDITLEGKDDTSDDDDDNNDVITNTERLPEEMGKHCHSATSNRALSPLNAFSSSLQFHGSSSTTTYSAASAFLESPQGQKTEKPLVSISDAKTNGSAKHTCKPTPEVQKHTSSNTTHLSGPDSFTAQLLPDSTNEFKRKKSYFESFSQATSTSQKQSNFSPVTQCQTNASTQGNMPKPAVPKKAILETNPGTSTNQDYADKLVKPFSYLNGPTRTGIEGNKLKPVVPKKSFSTIKCKNQPVSGSSHASQPPVLNNSTLMMNAFTDDLSSRSAISFAPANSAEKTINLMTQEKTTINGNTRKPAVPKKPLSLTKRFINQPVTSTDPSRCSQSHGLAKPFSNLNSQESTNRPTNSVFGNRPAPAEQKSTSSPTSTSGIEQSRQVECVPYTGIRHIKSYFESLSRPQH